MQHVRVYEEEWFVQPCFYCGVALFFSGMWINLQSDSILRSSPQPSTLNPQPSTLNPQPILLHAPSAHVAISCILRLQSFLANLVL